MVAPSMAPRPLESVVWAALQDVHDPEIPAISVVDLGVIRGVSVGEGSVRVELLPTFVGCPAINVLQDAITERLRGFADDVRVDISFAEPWTTERITDVGRTALRAAGFAPPPDNDLVAECPYCGSRDTESGDQLLPRLQATLRAVQGGVTSRVSSWCCAAFLSFRRWFAHSPKRAIVGALLYNHPIRARTVAGSIERPWLPLVRENS